jgi:MraZ protein
MLLGEYEHTLDDKNRLTLPAKFRQALGGGVVVTRGMDGCLFVLDRLEGLNTFSREARQMNRFIFAGATETDVDKQGRVMLPQPLIEHASLGREVVVAGIRDHVEIWDRTAWRKQLEEVEGSVELVAERLAAKQD